METLTVLRKLICFAITFQLLFACKSKESSPVSHIPTRPSPQMININGVLSSISNFIIPTSYASEVILYSLERGGERAILAQSSLSTNNRFHIKIEKNRVKNKVIMLEVLNSPVGDRSIILTTEENATLNLNSETHNEAKEQYQILLSTLSQDEVTPQQVLEVVKIHPEFTKIIIGAFNDLNETINLERGGYLTLNIFLGQLQFILRNAEAFKALQRKLKKFSVNEMDCRTLIYEIHMIYRKWMDNNAIIILGDCPEELNELSFVNQSEKDLEFELFFIPISEEAKNIWGEYRYRIYYGRGAVFFETIQNLVNKMEKYKSNDQVTFEILLRDIESGKVDSCLFNLGEQKEEFQSL